MGVNGLKLPPQGWDLALPEPENLGGGRGLGYGKISILVWVLVIVGLTGNLRY